MDAKICLMFAIGFSLSVDAFPFKDRFLFARDADTLQFLLQKRADDMDETTEVTVSAEEVMFQYDTNKDGFITKEEFESAYAESDMTDEDIATSVYWFMVFGDQNGDEKITLAELKNVQGMSK